MKIAYNTCYGGFGLSKEAILLGKKLSGNDMWSCPSFDTSTRGDPILIQVIETLGSKANGRCADLSIKEIPDGSRYDIDEYDGWEDILPPREKGWD